MLLREKANARAGREGKFSAWLVFPAIALKVMEKIGNSIKLECRTRHQMANDLNTSYLSPIQSDPTRRATT